jgi:hypothetical protein
MDELIEKLKKQAGLTDKQAIEAITIIKDYARTKFPIFAGAIDKVFSKYAPAREDEDFLDT